MINFLSDLDINSMEHELMKIDRNFEWLGKLFTFRLSHHCVHEISIH